jgi:hypothetical protein
LVVVRDVKEIAARCYLAMVMGKSQRGISVTVIWNS